MARTNTTYTASPTRFRSPQRSPARERTSEDGSQYEMDLDALGLNSTFDSTGIDEAHEPKVDVVDTSDIEGPEDFTMNMTYWMTADLPIAQIKSRKEAHTRMTELRGDAQVINAAQDTSEEAGDRAIIEDSSRTRGHTDEFNSASPTVRANGTIEGQSNSTPPSERSMEHDEKVRSFLSALPDISDLDDAVVSTPLQVNRQNLLQVPNSSAPRARSLQPTVEDYDTPRKPTQETVIHHIPEPTIDIIDTTEHDSLRNQIAELQSRLEQQELASRTRITELETLLSYTRSDLEATRADNYKHKEEAMTLKRAIEQEMKEGDASRSSTEARLKAQEKEHNARMQELGEELRLQNLAKLQNQREDFERQLRELEEAKRAVDGEVETRGQLLCKIENELAQLRRANEHELQGIRSTSADEKKSEVDFAEERNQLHERLSSLQLRADTLQVELEKATSEAKAAREEVQNKDGLNASAETEKKANTAQIANLESHLAAARAEIAEKNELAQQNSEFKFRIENLQSQLKMFRFESNATGRESMRITELESRLESLHSQLQAARADLATKDQEIFRHIDEQERCEQRLNVAQGRVEGLENTMTTLRKQLAETHRNSAKARTDVERLERELGDANDRLQDARTEADRRVADVDKKLNTMKDLKLEAENSFKELQSQHNNLVEDHEEKIEDVRDKAEDAVRKAGALIEQERSEKKRVIKEFKKLSSELEKLRSEAAQKVVEDEASSDESTVSLSSQSNAKDTEIEKLRILVRKQAATLKTLKSETTSLRKANTQLKAAQTDSTTIESLESQLVTLRTENSTLRSQLSSQQDDFEAINKAMDERLASMMSKVLKDRAKTVIGKRDGQWKESTSKARDERDLMGKVLLREWGRQEVGVADEERGERQAYRYQYVKRP